MPITYFPGVHRNLSAFQEIGLSYRRYAMTPTKIRDAELAASTDEITWRHVWLKKAMVDAGNPSRETTARRKTIAKMSPARRLEKLRRLRATLEPPRSWLYEK